MALFPGLSCWVSDDFWPERLFTFFFFPDLVLCFAKVRKLIGRLDWISMASLWKSFFFPLQNVLGFSLGVGCHSRPRTTSLPSKPETSSDLCKRVCSSSKLPCPSEELSAARQWLNSSARPNLWALFSFSVSGSDSAFMSASTPSWVWCARHFPRDLQTMANLVPGNPVREAGEVFCEVRRVASPDVAMKDIPSMP